MQGCDAFHLAGGALTWRREGVRRPRTQAPEAPTCRAPARGMRAGHVKAGRPKNRTCAHIPPEDAAVYKSGGQMTHDVGMGGTL